jgi:hypothetical protein
MRLSGRLARIEKAVAPNMRVVDQRRQYAEEVAQRRQAAWEYMRPTMSDEHAVMVVDAYARGLNDPSHPEYNSPAGMLLRRCLQAMSPRTHWPYCDIPPEVALAMPPAVAEVYLAHGPSPFHDCEDCGYNLPHGYFDACPLCGGRIGWYAYWERRKSERGYE